MKKTNYHTHTTRCMHAIGSEKEYVEAAIAEGYEILGFSDHTPWKYDSDFISTVRMTLNQFEDYKQTVLALKEEYKDQIDIQLGLEVEYFPRYMYWLKKFILEENLDYIILGNHFRGSDEDGEYYGVSVTTHESLKDYIDSSIAAMKTGLYSYMAHPDLFMRRYEEFDEFARKEVLRLCEASKLYDVPFEYNINGMNYNEKMRIENYPHHNFWEAAGSVGAKAFIGVDAHDPELLLRKDYYEKAKIELENYGIDICDEIDTNRLKKLKSQF